MGSTLKNNFITTINKMSTILQDVYVNKISLVTKDELPAVPKATLQFSLKKTKEKKESNLEKLEKTIKADRLDSIIGKMTSI